MHALKHTNGPGLRVLSDAVWYGPGYCGICGQRDTDSIYSPLIPQQVLYWDCDDGWRVGVLCVDCGEEAATHGPKDDDYAVQTDDEDNTGVQEFKIDLLSLDGDEDATYTESEDM